ncbi:MAG TPA: protein kinase [Thermoanaerobaculia bacterium]|nr:protein kinase [Thermoanaerobaculia bacterium]
MGFYCIHCRSDIDPKYKACPYCGEAISDFLRRHLEHPIDGKYQILARLGAGGMGEVFKALHIHLNALRVIKLMRPNIAADPGAHERFTREARLATRIQHPNVATLYDFSTLEDGSRYMVWEYIEGTNLHELLEERGPLSPRYAAQLAAQALHGLDAIHRAGIVHRDISPENLMITLADGEERVKIIDLGIAKQSDGDTDTQTKTGMFVGKWKYCSPEQLGMLPEGERIDGRSDIYSFSIVLYEMLTGIPPFHADTPHGYLVQHASEKPRSLRDSNPSVPESPELEALIFKGMEKDRRNRFATAREFARELEKLIPTLADEPGARAFPTVAERTEEPTAVAGRIVSDAPTVVTTPQDVETQVIPAVAATDRSTLPAVETERSILPGEPTDRTTIPASVAGPAAITEIGPVGAGKPKLPVLLGAAAAAVVLLVGGVMMLRHGGETAPAPDRPVSASVVAAPQGHLGIHAYPWAHVTSIRNLDSGRTIDLKEPVVTPAPIDLAPGRYEVTLSNPAFGAPITKTIEIRAGEEEILSISFTDAEKVQLPSFGERP